MCCISKWSYVCSMCHCIYLVGFHLRIIFLQMHEDNGVKFYFERGIKEFVGSDGKVTEAVLSDDTRLPADLCIMGVGKGNNSLKKRLFSSINATNISNIGIFIGVVPATDFIKGSGVEMTDRGFIPVNKVSSQK